MKTIARIASTLKVVLILAVLLCGTDLLAQDFDCATPDEEEAAMMGGGGGCSDQSMYIPDGSNNYQNTPSLVFRLNYHFIRPSDGSGPFTGDMTPIVTSEVAGMNWFYGDIDLPTLPVTPAAPYIEDSRVRFVLDGIYYHDDDLRYQHYLNATGYLAIPLRNEFGVNITTVINIFYYQNNANPSSYGIGYMDVVGMHNCFPSSAHGLLAHELGHSIGLSHTFSCGSTTCFDDGISDTYHPDCNTGWVSCGVNQNWHNPGPNGCTLQGTGVSNNIMGYNSCRKYLSPMQMGRIHYGSITNPTRRMYVKCTPDAFNPTMVISQSAVWESSKIINSNIEIQPGVTLDVRCTLYMSPHAKVIIKQGARLIIDGGVLTSHSGGCHDFWSGIEAWGTTSQHQYPSNNPTYQGLLVLKNGARIEHAREAFTNWNPGDWNSIGGVIQVQGTLSQTDPTFWNCRRSAAFMAYQNFQPGYPTALRPNQSYFNYAHFEVDDDYRGGDDFYAHVSLWGVDGIVFRACTMENAQSTPGTIAESSKLGKGIVSIDANYTVTGNCTVLLPYGTPCPEANLDRGSMVGLDYGIHALDGGTGRGFTANHLRIENNVVGVYGSGVPMTVTRNQFVLGDRAVVMDESVESTFQEDFHRGVSTQQSQSFRIEENTFHRAANSNSGGNTAIVIENSGANNTQVYKNDAYDMDIGYIGEGNCIDVTMASSVGHQFLCNTNSADNQNFWVRGENQKMGTPTWMHSIRTQQGSDATPAENMFDQEINVLDASDYKNETPWVINYWHAGGQAQPLDVTPGWVGVTLATGTNNCPSLFNGKELKLTEALVAQVHQELDDAKSAYINTAYVFNSLLDGGNTDAVVREVQESWPQDAWDLRNYLLSRSPYLSTEVLVEMMKKNILPQAMVLEVCLANPEATKKEGFIKWAEYEAPSPLPNYMIDLIAGSWESKTFRMQLEAEMGQHHADMTVAAELLQASFRADEDSIRVDDMLEVWQAMPNYGARYSETQVHLRRGDFISAKAVMDNLAAKYPMKGGREAERDRTLWYIGQLEALDNADRNIMQLDSVEVAQWKVFAEVAEDIPGTWARNVLCFGYDICLYGPGGAAGVNKSLRPIAPGATADAQPALRVHPNPASAWVAVSYHLVGEPEQPYARISDAQGREVRILSFNTQDGQQIWDIRGVPAGVYSVELFNAGTRLGTERVVVQPVE